MSLDKPKIPKITPTEQTVDQSLNSESETALRNLYRELIALNGFINLNHHEFETIEIQAIKGDITVIVSRLDENQSPIEQVLGSTDPEKQFLSFLSSFNITIDNIL